MFKHNTISKKDKQSLYSIIILGYFVNNRPHVTFNSMCILYVTTSSNTKIGQILLKHLCNIWIELLITKKQKDYKIK